MDVASSKESNVNPRLTFSFISAAISALAAAGLVTQAGPAFAEETTDVIEEVIARPLFRSVE